MTDDLATQRARAITAIARLELVSDGVMRSLDATLPAAVRPDGHGSFDPWTPSNVMAIGFSASLRQAGPGQDRLFLLPRHRRNPPPYPFAHHPQQLHVARRHPHPPRIGAPAPPPRRRRALPRRPPQHRQSSPARHNPCHRRRTFACASDHKPTPPSLPFALLLILPIPLIPHRILLLDLLRLSPHPTTRPPTASLVPLVVDHPHAAKRREGGQRRGGAADPKGDAAIRPGPTGRVVGVRPRRSLPTPLPLRAAPTAARSAGRSAARSCSGELREPVDVMGQPIVESRCKPTRCCWTQRP